MKILRPKSGGPRANQSILDQLWADMDFAYAKSKRRKSHHRHMKRGMCIGMAHAIAVMTNPYAPDFPDVWIKAEERYRNARHTKRSRQARAS